MNPSPAAPKQLLRLRAAQVGCLIAGTAALWLLAWIVAPWFSPLWPLERGGLIAISIGAALALTTGLPRWASPVFGAWLILWSIFSARGVHPPALIAALAGLGVMAAVARAWPRLPPARSSEADTRSAAPTQLELLWFAVAAAALAVSLWMLLDLSLGAGGASGGPEFLQHDRPPLRGDGALLLHCVLSLGVCVASLRWRARLSARLASKMSIWTPNLDERGASSSPRPVAALARTPEHMFALARVTGARVTGWAACWYLSSAAACALLLLHLSPILAPLREPDPDALQYALADLACRSDALFALWVVWMLARVTELCWRLALMIRLSSRVDGLDRAGEQGLQRGSSR